MVGQKFGTAAMRAGSQVASKMSVKSSASLGSNGAKFLGNNLNGAVSKVNFNTSNALGNTFKNTAISAAKQVTPTKTSLAFGLTGFAGQAISDQNQKGSASRLAADKTSYPEPESVKNPDKAVQADKVKDTFGKVSSAIDKVNTVAEGMEASLGPVTASVAAPMQAAVGAYNTGREAYKGLTGQEVSSITGGIASAVGKKAGIHNNEVQSPDLATAAKEVASKSGSGALGVASSLSGATDEIKKGHDSGVENKYNAFQNLGDTIKNPGKVQEQASQTAKNISQAVTSKANSTFESAKEKTSPSKAKTNTEGFNAKELSAKNKPNKDIATKLDKNSLKELDSIKQKMSGVSKSSDSNSKSATFNAQKQKGTQSQGRGI